MDPIFEAKNYFYLGNYQGAINEVNKKSKQLRDLVKMEADFFLYRSYLAQENWQLVLGEIRETESSPALQGVRALAAYLQAPSSNAEIVIATAKQWIDDGTVQASEHMQLLVATIFYAESLYEDALRVLNKTESLECMALTVQIYLRIDRLDLAEKQYSLMKSIDVDATPSLLTNAWICIAQGDDKIKEALSVFEELSEKYGPTPLLLNGRATCEILLKRFEKAESSLLSSIEKNSKDADTIANIITCYVNMKKPSEIVNRYINQLKTISPKHPAIESINNAEASFDRCKARYAGAN
eukprot:gene1199-1382_t